MSEKKIRFITDWKAEYRESGDCYILTGKAMNDDRFEDGKFIYSSMLLKIDYVNMVAETANTLYHLTGPERE